MFSVHTTHIPVGLLSNRHPTHGHDQGMLDWIMMCAPDIDVYNFPLQGELKSAPCHALDSQTKFSISLFICKEELAQYKNLQNILHGPGVLKEACYHSPGATPTHVHKNLNSLVMVEHKAK